MTAALEPAMHDFINQVLYGDCRDIMREMPSASVDFVLTDPPYLVNYVSRDGRTIAGDTRDDWLIPACAALYRLLKPDRFMVSFYGWNKVECFMHAWKDAGFRPVGHLVFAKRYHSRERYVRYTHECAYLLAKGDPPRPQVLLRDVLDWHYSGNTLHPTEKPVMALVPLIEAFSQVGDLVLDPFCGSGTTAVATRALGRRYIGIEKAWRYYTIARDRLAQPGRDEDDGYIASR